MKPKVYTVRSNARRDARKQGLDPDSVVASEGGFIIGSSKPKIKASPTDTKRAILRGMLLAGWQRADRLQSALDWQPHTIRGAISSLAKAESLSVERKREGTTTFYRAARAS